MDRIRHKRKTIARFARKRSGVAGLIIVAFFSHCAIFANLIAPDDPQRQVLKDQLLAPSLSCPLGTDDLGRDVLSRVIYGARISLSVGAISVGIAMMIGIPLGAVAGYCGGFIDMLLMRLIDIMLAFPSILLAISIVAALGPSLRNAMIAVGIVGIPTFARQVRASVLTVKELEFVLASRALGAGHLRLIFRTILPNCTGVIIVLSTLGIATAMLDAAGLSFLGLGAEPGTAEWGAMLSDGRKLITSAPWVVISPGLAIMLTVLGFNLFGDALRDMLDPKAKGVTEGRKT